MGVRRGDDWGRKGHAPADAVEVGDDRSATRVIAEARAAGRNAPALILLGGDLCRALGGRGDRRRIREGDGTIVVCDLGVIEAADIESYFLAHVVRRRRLWAGQFECVMNSPFLGGWNVAPRAHPGDGLLDIVSGRLGWRQRMAARRRVVAGHHLPHPDLHYRRRPSAVLDPEPGDRLFVDGVQLSFEGAVAVRVEPDAVSVVV